MCAGSAGTKFTERHQADKTSDHVCWVGISAVLCPEWSWSWSCCGTAGAHTPVVENFEPQPSVSRVMVLNILAKRVLPDAHIRCLCSQLCASNPIQLPLNLWIFGFPRFQIPLPKSPILLWMNVIARPARLQSGKSVTQPIPNPPWGQQASVLLGLTHSLILFENLECRTTPPYFIFKTDHGLIQKVSDLDVRMPVNPCLVHFNAFYIKGHWDGRQWAKGYLQNDWSLFLNWIKVKVLLFLKNTLWLFSVPRPKAHTSTVLKFDPVRGDVRHRVLDMLFSWAFPAIQDNSSFSMPARGCHFEVSHFSWVFILKISMVCFPESAKMNKLKMFSEA